MEEVAETTPPIACKAPVMEASLVWPETKRLVEVELVEVELMVSRRVIVEDAFAIRPAVIRSSVEVELPRATAVQGKAKTPPLVMYPASFAM